MTDNSQADDGERETNGVGRLYREYAAWLTRRLIRRYGDDGEDLVQETWLRVEPYSRAHEIRHPRAFLMRIAANAAVDAARRRGREWQPGAWDDEGWRGVEEAGQTEQVLLRQIILSMPAPLRSVFLLSRFDNLTYPEIADRLGISQKTVEWRMSKALAHCASKLRD